MKEIIFKMGTPTEALNITRLLLRNGFKVTSATIKYNLSKGLPGKIKKLSDYPLRLEGIYNGHDLRVLVTPLAAGCSCEGSHALYYILRAASFPIEERDITTIRNVRNGEVNMFLSHK